MRKSALFACLLLVVSLVNGFPGGAPIRACESMAPLHDGTPAKNSCPYSLIVSKTAVKPGETIQVIIEGPDFKGFIAQGRKVDGDSTPFGKFESGGPDSKAMKCHHDGGSITQTDGHVVKKSVKFSWIAPDVKGKYHILLTVIEDYSNTFCIGHSFEKIEVN